MKIIVPMAGWGSRLRPHTLTVPKPMLNIAGKPIVEWLVEDLVKNSTEKIDEIAFIIRADFGKNVEIKLEEIAKKHNATCSINYQDEPKGTAHAILCAKHALKGKVIVGFADTIFKADFIFDESVDGVIFTKKVEDPSAFGVVQLNDKGHIINFVEKPKTFVSDEAIIGIYYFKNGETLNNELQYLIDNNIMQGGEYQLTNALDNMKNKGMIFTSGIVDKWLDCGNKVATVDTNKQVLELNSNNNLIHSSMKSMHSVIIPPCYIGENVILENSIIGPFVSIGNNTTIKNSVIINSLIQDKSELKNIVMENSMIGNQVKINKVPSDLSLGDFCVEN